jgi:uncharacterized protein (DUF2236 family)
MRERLGLSWSARAELELRAIAAAVRSTFAAIPAQWRYLPIARAGFQRTALAAHEACAA